MKQERSNLRVGVAVVICAALSGCSGTMQGMIRGSGERISIAFTETGMSHGTLRTTLPGGETFEGKHVYQTGVAFGSGFGQVRSGGNTAFATSFGTISTYSGNNEAVLFGDKGRSMKCRFQVVDPITGMTAGGVGICQLSDGSVIDVQF